MPHIWENIMGNLSALDVANCMKVHKSMRKAMNQSVESCSRLRQSLDIGATASAIARGHVKSYVRIELKRDREPRERAGARVLFGFDHIFAIDNTWYHKQGETDRLDVLKLDPEHKIKYFKKSLLNRRIDNRYIWDPLVLPTQDAERSIIKFNGSRNKYGVLIEQSPEDASVIAIAENPVTLRCGKVWKEVMNEREKSRNPHCARYRLYTYVQKDRQNVLDIILTLLNDKGEPRKTTALCNLEFEGDSPIEDKHLTRSIIHSPNHEQVRELTIFIINL